MGWPDIIRGSAIDFQLEKMWQTAFSSVLYKKKQFLHVGQQVLTGESRVSVHIVALIIVTNGESENQKRQEKRVASCMALESNTRSGICEYWPESEGF